MPTIVLVGFAAIALWSLVAHRFERSGIAGPVVLALIGSLIVLVDIPAFVETVDSDVAEHVVELILAVLLFVDACEVKGGVFGGEGRMISRLVLIALPLSLALVVVTGLWLVPGVNLFVLIVVACVVMPTDFAPATALLRSPLIPARVRQILNVESGYNDGLISPIFGMSLAIAVVLPTLITVADSGAEPTGSTETELEKNLEDFVNAFLGAVPATVVAIVVGVLLGGLIGVLTRWASGRGFANATGIRIVMLITPLLTYGIATLHGIGANGFVAAFVAGVMFRFTRTRKTQQLSIAHDELVLVEEVGTFATNFVWFVLGAMTTEMIVRGVDWRLLVLAVLALTVFRAVPVYLATLGSSVSWRDRTVIGFVGPRGTASIVFGLLAFNKLPTGVGDDVWDVAVLTVIGSILLHGLAAPYVVKRIARRSSAS
ncbi:cation:proton antiporter [Leifsonia lichenia]